MNYTQTNQRRKTMNYTQTNQRRKTMNWKQKILLPLVAAIYLPCALAVEGGNINQDLIDAVVKGDSAQVVTLIKQGGVDVNQRFTFQGTENMSLLSLAITIDDAKMVEIMIDNGADVNEIITTGSGSTVSLLILSLTVTKDGKSAALLIQNGVDVLAKENRRALLNAVPYPEIVRMLVDKGVDMEEKGAIYEMTPLMTAVFYNFTDSVTIMLDEGAKINSSDAFGKTPLMHTMESGDVEMAKLLLDRGADVNFNEKDTPLMYALKFTRHNRSEMINLLLDRGAEVNLQGNWGQTALMYAMGPQRMASLSDWSADINEIKMLINLGADVHTTDNDGDTAMVYAVRAEQPNPDVVKLLLDEGAKIENSLLHVLFSGVWSDARYQNFGQPIAEMLIKNGADIHALDDRGMNILNSTAKTLAAPAFAMLIDKGVYLHGRGHQGRTILMSVLQDSDWKEEKKIKVLLDGGFKDIEAKDNKGRTALMYAAGVGAIGSNRSLLNAGADINARDNEGLTPLMHALKRLRRRRNENIQILLDAGANVNARDNQGRTPLMYAHYPSTIEPLLNMGANISAVDNNGKTALDYAQEKLATLKSKWWEGDSRSAESGIELLKKRGAE